MRVFRFRIAEAIAALTGTNSADAFSAMTTPPRAEMGEYAFPCFALAKTHKKAPAVLAKEIAATLKLDPSTAVERVEAAGAYVNFGLKRPIVTELVLRDSLQKGASVGRSEHGHAKTIVLDYSSPNIAKPFHVGHLRSTIIGAALHRIYDHLGYKTVGINHLGDWGTQFGKQIVALKHWGTDADLKDLMALNRLYVRYHQEEPNHPELESEAREWFRRQEAGDAEALGLWRSIRETSLEYFKRIYDRLGVRFDEYTGESFFNDKMEAVIQEASSKGLTTISDGALIVDLSKKGIETPALLRKADGTTLYITRDLAAAEYRHRTYQFHKMLYVVGIGQALHFKQLLEVLKMMGHDWADSCAHVGFGLVHGMSTRKGNVVYLEELLDEARDRALKHMRENVEKRQDLEDEAGVAQAVGKAAIFFSDLSRQRVKDYTFEWDRAIAFDGDTGPYLMVAYARIAGIIRKCGFELDPNADLSMLVEQEAYGLVRHIAQFEDKLLEAAAAYEPSILAGYLLDLSHALHGSYYKLWVKDEERSIAGARLVLFTVVRNVLAAGMGLLGIPVLEKM